MKHALILLLLLSGCRSAEEIAAAKAAKAAAKAQEYMTKAILADPSIMLPQVRVDTIIMYTEPTAIAVGRVYQQHSMDSLMMYCSDLLSVYRGKLDESSRKYGELQSQKMRKALCSFAPLDTTDGPCGMRVWEDGGMIRLFHNKAGERVDTVYQYVSREVQAKPCPPVSRVRSWPWLAFLLGMLVMGGLWFWFAFMKGSHRNP